MAKIIIMVGLSASGKSSIAEDLRKNVNAEIVSSDKIREELSFYEDQSRNAEVFEIFHKRIRDGLKSGKTMIADATNITIKSRRPLINIAKRANAVVEVYLVIKPYEKCIKDDALREHSVGYKVISKQVKRFEVPFYEEGFDNIKLIGEKSSDCFSFFTNWLRDADGYNQYNPHHSLTLGEHCRKVSEIFNYYAEHDMIEKYGDGVLYHDIGKMDTRSFDDDNIAHYYAHGNVGAYIYILNMFGQTNERYILNNAFVVNYHMRPFTWTEDKTREKYRKVFGDEKYNVLMLLNDCDKKGSKE